MVGEKRIKGDCMENTQDGSITDSRVQKVLEIDPKLVEEYLSAKAITKHYWNKICKLYTEEND